MSNRATLEGTKRFAEKWRGRATDEHFREAGELVVSSIGIGTYLGQPDPQTDTAYTEAIVAAVENGINFLDSAINYRFQRSERSIGAALQQLAAKGIPRDEIVVCTKGGYLTPDEAMPSDPNEYFFREYIQPGIFSAKDIAGGSHCMTPRFLENQLGRSLKNLGVASVDIYYLHNPETQLAEMEAIAKQVAGDKHRFRFVQLPFNLGMTEALTLGNQTIAGKQMTIMEAASELGITLIASASLLQGQVARNLPSFVAQALGLRNDAERALQFVRSAPGITTALVGMSRAEHAHANARLVSVPPATLDQFSQLFSRGETA